MIVSRTLAAAGLAVVILGGACGLSTYGTQEVGSGGATSSSSSVGSGGSITSSSVGSGGASTSSNVSSGGGLGGSGGMGGTGGMTTSSSSSSSGMPTHCSNGKKDMGETDVDCGGGECSPCPQGQGCATDTDCDALSCQQGICCGTTCTGACQSCNGADTGDPAHSGTCMAVVAGKDPGMLCTSSVGGKCDGAGMCACGNGKLDAGETDVDCGGPACNKCDNGKLCGAGGDCTSTHCYDPGGGGSKVCCDQDCTGTCSTCGLKISYQNQQQQNVTVSWMGQCVPVPSGVQAKCSSGKACNDAQQCVTGKTDFSASCNGNGECASGFCETQFFHQCFPATEAQGAPCISSYWCNSNMCDSTTNLCK